MKKQYHWVGMCTIALAGLLAIPSFAQDITAEEIMDRMADTSGGKERYAEIENMTVKGRMEISGMGLTGTMVTYTARPASLLTDIELPGIGNIKRGVSDGVVWETSAVTGPRIVTGAEADMMLRELDLEGEVNWREKYQEVTLKGEELYNDKECYVLELVQKEGSEMTMYIDKETWLAAGTKMNMETQMGNLPIEIIFDEYREVDGINTPVKMIQKVMMQTIIIYMDEIKYNVDLPEDTFALPDDIQALLQEQQTEGESVDSEKAA